METTPSHRSISIFPLDRNASSPGGGAGTSGGGCGGKVVSMGFRKLDKSHHRHKPQRLILKEKAPADLIRL